jgi:pre-mRNA-splicing factor SYF2/beta-D-xylosidase 4
LNTSAHYRTLPFCDASLSVEARVAYALSKMTKAEKIGMLGTNNPPIAALGVPAYGWWSEATSGASSGRKTQTTKFAYPITTGMAFNRSLWYATGAHIGGEARALMNAGESFSTFWAPVINLAREPRWGRNIETPGEDPYLSGEYATSFVKGMQHSDDGHLLTSACCKHYVANEMDGTAERDGEVEDRQRVDSNVTLQDLLDSYMVPFQACVEKGQVSGLMCSYVTSLHCVFPTTAVCPKTRSYG